MRGLVLGSDPRLRHNILSLDLLSGLNLWCVWRKGLGGSDFFKDQRRLGVGVDRGAHARKASAVQRCGSEGMKRPPMLGRSVAAIPFPPVAGIFARIVGHDAVAGHLGD